MGKAMVSSTHAYINTYAIVVTGLCTISNIVAVERILIIGMKAT